jgi:hypothetical protein
MYNQGLLNNKDGTITNPQNNVEADFFSTFPWTNFQIFFYIERRIAVIVAPSEIDQIEANDNKL